MYIQPHTHTSHASALTQTHTYAYTIASLHTRHTHARTNTHTHTHTHTHAHAKAMLHRIAQPTYAVRTKLVNLHHILFQTDDMQYYIAQREYTARIEG